MSLVAPRTTPLTLRSPLPRWLLRGMLGAGLLALLVSRAALAQVPDTFTNLKVLPRNISRQQLLGTMRAFTGALGVRCDYCHAAAGDAARPAAGAPTAPGAAAPGAPGAPERLNFASDDKAQKRIARGMLQMVQGINGEYLAKIPDLADQERVQVRCVTCHHGVPVPRTLADVLSQDVSEKGAPAAVADYRRLKALFYGSGAYDFREGSLLEVARALRGSNKPDDALAILALAGEEFPQSAAVAAEQAEALLLKGDRAGAIARLQRALELQPQNEQLRRRLAQVQGGG